MRLTLLCHAATKATRAARFPVDEPIEWAAVETLACHRLRRARHDRCLTSPARRAVQTAAALGLRPMVEPLLRDVDHGQWAGRTVEAVHRDDPPGVEAWLRDPDASPHGGESIAALIARVAEWLAAQAGEPGHTIAVTHAAVIRAAIVHALRAPAASFWRIDVAPLAIATLSGDGGYLTFRGLAVPRDGE